MRELDHAPEGTDRVTVEVEELRTGPAETQIMTFVIADVRGYTRFTQERGDEEAARLAARFAEIVRARVQAGHGSVIELRGDEALAVFGSSRRAIRAAVDLQQHFLDGTRADPDLPLPVGIGIDAGEGVPVEGGYRGGALNLAARLCSEAGPGEILGSQSVVQLARKLPQIQYIDRGQLQVKGMSEPVQVFAIVPEGIDVADQITEFVPQAPDRSPSRRTRFRILGPLDVDRDGEPIALGGPKQRAVLAHLLVRANELVATETLVDEIWGDEGQESARNTLYTYVSMLRRSLGHDRIESRTPGYRLKLDPSELDAARFEKLIKDARKALVIDPGIAATVLDEALGLWRGPALADVAEQGSLMSEAMRLDELRLIASEERFDALLAIGESRIIAEAEILVDRHPLRERIWRQLMLALYREGRQADALNAYQRAREVLADELGIDPSPGLVRLHEQILKQDPKLELRGEPLRGYRLLEKIGEGSTGVVFRAIQPHVGRDVAVKIFHEQIASDPEFVRRFEQEARAVAALEHPHIAPIYDYWREPGRAYIVSRYLKGGSFDAVQIRGERLERQRLDLVVEQIASALAFAHGRQVAHGSVRSSNVLFDGEQNAYLTDFRVGVGSPPDATDDVAGLASLVRELFAGDVPRRVDELLDAVELGVDPPAAHAFAVAVRDALEPGVVASAAAAGVRNPYKGLRAFAEADASDFFGRSELTARLLSRAGEPGEGSRFLAVVGPSGSGKSSVVRAGMVPAIRRGALGEPDRVFVAEMLPGAHPIEELESALLRVATHPISQLHDLLDRGTRGLLEALDLVLPAPTELVLVVDQLEEIFTLTSDERDRELFLESLRVATADPDSRLTVVATLRADFYDRPLVYPRFGQLLAARTEAVPPLTPDELEQAIRSPAQGVGVSVESGLVAEIIADVAHQPGALPLLQYALTELFERRDGALSLASYREIGGVAGALSARADRLFESSGPEGRRATKQVFLRLVSLGEGRQDTRRRVMQSELHELGVDPPAIDSVVDAYGHHRLLTFDRDPATREPTVEIAHEALLSAWDRFRGWIDGAREDLRQDQRLARAAGEWRGADRDPSFLLHGARLQQVETWSLATDLALGSPERRYLKASLEQRDRQLAEEEQRREREERTERRSRSRLRALVAVLGAAALVAGTLTVVAVDQRSQARREARLATARGLASAADANLEIDPERSILLAVEAVEVARSGDGSVPSEVQEALHRAITASRVVMSMPGVGGRLDWSPAGDVFVAEGSAGSGVVDIRDVETGRSIRSFPGHDGDITDVVFSPDGTMLATTGVDGLLKVWDTSDGAVLMQVDGVGDARGPSFSDDGKLAAAAWPREGVVRVLNTSTDRAVRIFGDLRGANATSLGPDGSRIAVSTLRLGSGDRFSRVYLIDVASSDRVRVEGTGVAEVADVAWSPHGDLVAAGADAALMIWESATGELRHEIAGHTGFITSVDWRPDPSSRVLVTGAEDGTARVWRIEVSGARETMSLASSGMTNVVGVAFSPDGTRVMTGNDLTSPQSMIWDVSPAGSAEWANLPADAFGEARFVADRRLLASGGGGPWSGLVTLWDIAAVSEPRGIRIFERPGYGDCCASGLRVSSDGATFAALFFDAGISVRDVATREEFLFVPTSPADEDVITPFDLSPDGRYVAIGMDRDRAVRTFQLAGYEVAAYRALRILDRSGREVRAPLREGRGFRVNGFRFAPDGRLIVTASGRGADQRLRIWNWERGVVVTEISGAFDLGYSGPELAFDPSGRLIATVADRLVRIWSVESGAPVATLPRQPAEILAIAFSPDGGSVATAASDGTVRLFDVARETQRLVLQGPIEDARRLTDDEEGYLFARSVAFSPDGSLLASVDGTTVRVWALDIDDLLEIAGRNVTRSLTGEECRQYLHVETCPAA